MLTKEMQDTLNRLIQLELTSAYLYLAMSVYFSRVNMSGFAHWLQLQHDEERGHAAQLMKYVVDRGGTIELKALPEQPVNFGSPLEAFQYVLSHEQSVTNTYRQAYASAAGDPQTLALLQGFLQEQVDEEAQATVIVGRLQMNSGNPAGLILIDQELGQRKD
ncbi:ferritin [Ectobacillus ponti]|uniref:Ferritin n=1 Tax=Ectobacillus ponti TaxID=2961894 RepID=A0AA42BPV4_9BACI|nr:ferritin [Ectobacillus ponti]MCP8969177.1 ferritin [Ectobacillus ponti]